MNNELMNLQAVDLDAGQVFSGRPSGRLIKGYDTPGPYSPSADPDYLFHESSRDVIVWFLEKSDPLYIFGPPAAARPAWSRSWPLGSTTRSLKSPGTAAWNSPIWSAISASGTARWSSNTAP